MFSTLSKKSLRQVGLILSIGVSGVKNEINTNNHLQHCLFCAKSMEIAFNLILVDLLRFATVNGKWYYALAKPMYHEQPSY